MLNQSNKPLQKSRKITMLPPAIRTLISVSIHKSPRFQCYSIAVAFFSSSAPAQKSKPLLDYFVKNHNFRPDLALKAASRLNNLGKPDKFDTVISFLKASGFSKTQIEEAVSRKPKLLSASIDKTLKPKLKIFQDLGFSNSDVADIVASDPWVLFRSGEGRLVPSISGLKSVVGSNAGVIKLLKTSGWFLKYDLDKTLLPNIDFLLSCGISLPQIVRYMFSFPRFFLNKPETMKQFVKRADEFGLSRDSKMFLPAIRTLSSMTEENWGLKLKLFRSLGFSEDDIRVTFNKTPQVFAVSERKIKEVTDFLLGIKGIDISFVINKPVVLICSVEHRLKPRLAVLEILESKDLPSRKPSWSTVFKLSEEQFKERYVLPYLQELEKALVSVEGYRCGSKDLRVWLERFDD